MVECFGTPISVHVSYDLATGILDPEIDTTTQTRDQATKISSSFHFQDSRNLPLSISISKHALAFEVSNTIISDTIHPNLPIKNAIAHPPS